jgi:hypothetical protein
MKAGAAATFRRSTVELAERAGRDLTKGSAAQIVFKSISAFRHLVGGSGSAGINIRPFLGRFLLAGLAARHPLTAEPQTVSGPEQAAMIEKLHKSFLTNFVQLL